MLDEDSINLFDNLLAYDPSERISAERCERHRIFYKLCYLAIFVAIIIISIPYIDIFH